MGAGIASGLIGGEIFGAISSGLVLTGELSVYLLERKISRLDIAKKSDSEVAIIYDIEKKFGSK